METEKKDEVIDSITDEEIEAGHSEDETPEEKAERLERTNKRLYARAKKAEGFEYVDGEWRKPEAKPTKETKTEKVNTDIGSLVKEELDKRFAEQTLGSLDVSDEVRELIKKTSQLEGITIAEAAKHPFVQFKIEEEARDARVNNASLGKSTKKSPSVDISKMNPEDFDITTEEGRKQWDEYNDKLRSS